MEKTMVVDYLLNKLESSDYEDAVEFIQMNLLNCLDGWDELYYMVHDEIALELMVHEYGLYEFISMIIDCDYELTDYVNLYRHTVSTEELADIYKKNILYVVERLMEDEDAMDELIAMMNN